jgi:hypothetical protein
MEEARHHRNEAERLLELARRISDPLAASLMRAAAARNFEQAAELEIAEKGSGGGKRS